MKTSTEKRLLTIVSTVAILTAMMYTSSALAVVYCTSPGVPVGCKPKPPTPPKMVETFIQQQQN